MRRIGFSTGALAKGDFREGIRLQRDIADAIELSALREDELDPLVSAIEELDLTSFHYISFHAPSQLQKWTERELVERLVKLPFKISSVIVHPNIISDFEVWNRLGSRLAIENMDQRYLVGRTSRELENFFDRLSEAKFCLDIGHARQVDPTMSVAAQLLMKYGDRLSEIHISEVDADSHHCAISTIACQAFQRILSHIDQMVPAIIESVVDPGAIDDEFQMARRCFCELNYRHVTPNSASAPVY
ncbi:Xylose isomerase-like TIM barrel [Bremerella volcania]|uniref:Xylose isomerase-like TIM barrel n=1 Tax=Bremerella volcania TaxID=2527984 RepID=A0A518C1D2_9BACT|nr:TIM barrel protein [Bremerella volcania]QDU73041.1 Xylose isomerase-like TIM barrel [Bremerella volcania]